MENIVCVVLLEKLLPFLEAEDRKRERTVCHSLVNTQLNSIEREEKRKKKNLLGCRSY